MRIDIVTIFPNVFFGPFSESIIKRAVDRRLVEINTVDLRNFTHDRHKSVDDRPYGGGPGMVMKPEPFFEAVESIKTDQAKVILLSPQGEMFNQYLAGKLALEKHLILLCGHYEGVDERVTEGLADKVVTIGDYVLTSGNIPAMAIVDSVVRLIPGVLGCDESGVEESFMDGLLEYPQFTRPEVFREMKVPEVLLNGNHEEIRKWRMGQAEKRTKQIRPDLYSKFKGELSDK